MNKRLLEAITSTNVEAARSILKTAGNDVINTRDDSGRTALHLAAELGTTEIATELLSHGADVNAVDAQRQSPLHIAARFCHVAIIDLLCRQPTVQIDAKDVNGKTALYVIPSERSDVFEHLLNRGADIWVKPQRIRNMLAHSRNNPELFKAILVAAPNCLTNSNPDRENSMAIYFRRTIEQSNPELLPLLNARINLTKAYRALLSVPSKLEDAKTHFYAAFKNSPQLVEQELLSIIEGKHIMLMKHPEAADNLLAAVADITHDIALRNLHQTATILSSPDPPTTNDSKDHQNSVITASKYSPTTVINEISALFSQNSTIYPHQDNAINNLIYTLLESKADKIHVDRLLYFVAEQLLQNYLNECNDPKIATPSSDNLKLSLVCLLTRNPKETNGLTNYILAELISVQSKTTAKGITRDELMKNHFNDILNIVVELEADFSHPPFADLKAQALQAKQTVESKPKSNARVPKLQWIQARVCAIESDKIEQDTEQHSPKTP